MTRSASNGSESLPDEAEALVRGRQNEKVLRAITLFEEHDETQSDDSERAEFHRLEGKVDIILELLTALLRDKWEVSKARNARFNTRGLCWDTSQAVDAGGLLDVNCYLLAHWPLPLKLSVRIVESVPLGEQFRVCGRIEGLSGVCRDWFSKLVFRRHRRTIAKRRKLS